MATSVSIGGMRSVVYTNVLHAVVKLVGLTLAAVVSLWAVGGMGELRASVPPEMFVWANVGLSQIFEWLIAGIGATFATQYVVQAITTVGDERKARRASFYSALVMVPFGLIAAFVGLCAAALHPDIDSLQALPRSSTTCRYAPRFGGRNGASLSIIASLLATIGWFAAGDPFGVDNAYIAVLTPLVVMTISHLADRNRPRGTPVPTATDAAAHPLRTSMRGRCATPLHRTSCTITLGPR